MHPMPHYRELETEIADLERLISAKKRTLEGIRQVCQHKWGKTVYAPIVHEGYQDPGDPVGTMGVDWRGPTWVPRQEIKRWTRTCATCGKVEETQSTDKKIEEVPVFNERRW